MIQQGKQYDLRIDAVSFEHLYLQSKNQNEFNYDHYENSVPEHTDEVEAYENDGNQYKVQYPTVEKPQDQGPPIQFKPSNIQTNNPFYEDYAQEPENIHTMIKHEEELKPIHSLDSWGTLEPISEQQKPKQIGIRPPEPKRPAQARRQTADPPKSSGIFTMPDVKQTRTEISEDLFANPSVVNQTNKQPQNGQALYPDFPQSGNPFEIFEARNLTLNTQPAAQIPQQAQYNTGMPINYHMPNMQFYTGNPYFQQYGPQK